MTLTPMRFCRHTWHHNPKTLQIESRKRTIELSPPNNSSELMLLGERLRAVSGTGELYGDDCMAQYLELLALYRSGERGVLCIPRLPAVVACFTELELTASPVDGVLGYRFRFVAADSPDIAGEPFYTTSSAGESLWDISYRLSMPIEELVRLNPRIRYIDAALYNERVRIC